MGSRLHGGSPARCDLEDDAAVLRAVARHELDRALPDQIPLHRPAHRLGSGSRTELRNDAAHVRFDRTRGDVQAGGDVGVSEAFVEALQDFNLPNGEVPPRVARIDLNIRGIAAHDIGGDARWKDHPSARDFVEGFDEGFLGAILQEIPVDADAGEGADILIEVITAEHEDLDVRPLATETAGQVDAGGPLHPNVKDHNGGSGLLHDLNRFLGAGGLPHDFEPNVPSQPPPDSLAKHAVVIDDEDSCRGIHCWPPTMYGMRAETIVPVPP